MHKRLTMAISLVPAPVLAQASGLAASTEGAGIAISNLFFVLLAVTIVASVIRAIVTGRDFHVPLMLGAFAGMFKVMSSILNTTMGVADSAGPTLPVVPGLEDWFENHWLMLVAVAMGLLTAGYFGVRQLNRVEIARRIKADRSELLGALLQAEQLLQHWNTLALPTSATKREHDRVKDMRSTLAGIRSRLMPLLEQVQTGEPMNANQRVHFERDTRTLNERERSGDAPSRSTPDASPSRREASAETSRRRQSGQPSGRVSDSGSSSLLLAPLITIAAVNQMSDRCDPGESTQAPEACRFDDGDSGSCIDQSPCDSSSFGSD